MNRKKGLLPLAYFLLAFAGHALYYGGDVAQKALLLLAYYALTGAGALLLADERGTYAALLFHLSAALSACSAALLLALLSHATGIFGGTLLPACVALLTLLSLERVRPGVTLKAACGALALLLPVAHAEAGGMTLLACALPLLPPLALGRIAARKPRRAALAGYAAAVTLLSMPLLDLANRSGGTPLHSADSEGFLVAYDPLSGVAAIPRVPPICEVAAGSAEIGAARTFRFGFVSLLPGRRYAEPEGIPGAVDLVETDGGADRPAFVPDCLRLLPGRGALPYGPRDLLRVEIVRGALGQPYLPAPPSKVGERFAFPRRLVAAAPARPFLRADGELLHLLEEVAAEEGVERALTGFDGEGRLLSRAPLPFEPSGLEVCDGPLLFGRLLDPVTQGETHLVEFRDRTGAVVAGFVLPERIHRVVPLPGRSGAAVVTEGAVTLLFRDGRSGATVARGGGGPAEGAATGEALHLLDYFTRTLRSFSLPDLAPLPCAAPAADFLAVSGGALLLADHGDNTLHLRRSGEAEFAPLPEPRKGIRFLAPSLDGGFLVGFDGGLARLDGAGRESARGERTPPFPPEPLPGGYAAATEDAILLLSPNLAPRSTLPGVRTRP